MVQAALTLFLVGLAAPFPPFESHPPVTLTWVFPIESARHVISEFTSGARPIPGACQADEKNAEVTASCKRFAYHKFLRFLLLLQTLLIPLLFLLRARRTANRLHAQLTLESCEGRAWVGTVGPRVFLRPDVHAWSFALWQVQVLDKEGRVHRIDLPMSAPRPLPGRRFWVARYRWGGRTREMGGLYAPHMALLSSPES